MSMEQRKKVVAEALTWLKTPYHLNARIKGAGVDCGTFLIASFAGAGLIDVVDLGTFKSDFHLHRSDEVYVTWIKRYCREVTREPLPGDIILYRFGRILSHGALVVNWPQIIHANIGVGCVLANGVTDVMARRQAAIYSFWEEPLAKILETASPSLDGRGLGGG